MMNSLQAVSSWVDDFDNPTEGKLGLLNAMYSLGALMAIPFVPTVSQYLGRRWSIVVGSLILCMGAGLQAGSRNTDMFLASRWVLGFGIPFAIVNGSSLIAELSCTYNISFKHFKLPFLESSSNSSYVCC